MDLSGIEALAAAGLMVMSLCATTVQGAEFVVFSTISAKEALIELIPVSYLRSATARAVLRRKGLDPA